MRHARIVDEDVDAPEVLPGRVHEPLAVIAARRVGDDAERGGALRFQVSHRALQALGVATRDYHGRAVLGQPRTDLGPDPAATAGDDGHLAVERPLHPRPAPGAAAPAPPTAASVLSRPAGSSTEWPRASVMMRRSRPVRTRPGPTSTNVVAPSSASRRTQSVHRTGLATWRSRNGRTSEAARVT